MILMISEAQATEEGDEGRAKLNAFGPSRRPLITVSLMSSMSDFWVNESPFDFFCKVLLIASVMPELIDNPIQQLIA